jgi:hypothetical protein
MGTIAGLEGTVLCFSGFELDSERAELRRPDGETIKLRPKALEILRLLAGNARQSPLVLIGPMRKPGEDPSLSRPPAARRLTVCQLKAFAVTRCVSKEFQPDLSRGLRTDHAVDGRGGLAGELTYRPRLFRHLDRQRASLTAANFSRIPPATQRIKQRHEREPSRRQIIFHAQRISLEFTALDNAGVLQLAKLQGEHPVRDGGVVPAQVAEAFRALLQIVDQQTGPATAYDLHHFFDGTTGDEIFHLITRGYKKVRYLLGPGYP